MNLLELRERIRACTACDLRQQARQPVPWSGATPASYMVVGMAPGVREDIENRPWIGPAGFLLQSLLKDATFPMHDIAYANAVNCFPGRNMGGDNPPTQPQLDACNQHLRDQITVINPRWILVFGGTALQAFRPDLKLGNVHGKPLYLDYGLGRRVVLWTTYHPAAALRPGRYKQDITDDLAAFWGWRRSGEIWPETCYTCGKPVHRYDGWGHATCEMHSMRQLSLLTS